eukprot:8667400-Heterocapsa_arctica.AAC.1
MIHRSWKRCVLSSVKNKRLDEYIVPVLPIEKNQVQMVHRQKVTNNVAIWNAMVVRTVNKKEVSETPGAKLAMDTEHNKLEKKGVWDLPTVREKSEVMAEASRLGVKCHFGMVYGICGEG